MHRRVCTRFRIRVWCAGASSIADRANTRLRRIGNCFWSATRFDFVVTVPRREYTVPINGGTKCTRKASS
jgi:hypothetical protein